MYDTFLPQWWSFTIFNYLKLKICTEKNSELVLHSACAERYIERIAILDTNVAKLKFLPVGSEYSQVFLRSVDASSTLKSGINVSLM